MDRIGLREIGRQTILGGCLCGEVTAAAGGDLLLLGGAIRLPGEDEGLLELRVQLVQAALVVDGVQQAGQGLRELRDLQRQHRDAPQLLPLPSRLAGPLKALRLGGLLLREGLCRQVQLHQQLPLALHPPQQRLARMDSSLPQGRRRLVQRGDHVSAAHSGDELLGHQQRGRRRASIRRCTACSWSSSAASWLSTADPLPASTASPALSAPRVMIAMPETPKLSNMNARIALIIIMIINHKRTATTATTPPTPQAIIITTSPFDVIGISLNSSSSLSFA
mmetsp:Transcript_3547/g.5322  ORF Transcript_3547/g.5322 Transcript_3547/m.5322 type:complete len:279 (+) Transcript_3547:1614-2450(+)